MLCWWHFSMTLQRRSRPPSTTSTQLFRQGNEALYAIKLSLSLSFSSFLPPPRGQRQSNLSRWQRGTSSKEIVKVIGIYYTLPLISKN